MLYSLALALASLAPGDRPRLESRPAAAAIVAFGARCRCAVAARPHRLHALAARIVHGHRGCR
jgi:hypothetical protein